MGERKGRSEWHEIEGVRIKVERKKERDQPGRRGECDGESDRNRGQGSYWAPNATATTNTNPHEVLTTFTCNAVQLHLLRGCVCVGTAVTMLRTARKVGGRAPVGQDRSSFMCCTVMSNDDSTQYSQHIPVPAFHSCILQDTAGIVPKQLQ